MVCPCLCLGVVVRFVFFHLLFVCVFRACLILDLQFYIFAYEVVLDGLEQVCACVRVCVCAQCDGPDSLAHFFFGPVAPKQIKGLDHYCSRSDDPECEF